MNKQELIEKINNLSHTLIWDTPYINREIVINLIKQLDEPQKPVVQKFIADWYEENKDNLELNLYRAIDLVPSNYRDGELSKFEEWLVDEHTTPFQTLVNMHQFGYEIEKEKKYCVKLKGITGNSGFLKYYDDTDRWIMGTSTNFIKTRVYHTRKQIEEAGFGEVFNSPLFEVREVE